MPHHMRTEGVSRWRTSKLILCVDSAMFVQMKNEGRMSNGDFDTSWFSMELQLYSIVIPLTG